MLSLLLAFSKRHNKLNGGAATVLPKYPKIEEDTEIRFLNGQYTVSFNFIIDKKFVIFQIQYTNSNNKKVLNDKIYLVNASYAAGRSRSSYVEELIIFIK